MKTLKEKWIDALPIIWGIISIVLLFYLIVWGVSRVIPTDEEIKQRQIRRVEEIRLCLDNNLHAYQAESGEWYCKP